MKLNRYAEKVPPAEYHVIVDIAPGKQGQATVTRSSGVKSVDAVALDFADGLLHAGRTTAGAAKDPRDAVPAGL